MKVVREKPGSPEELVAYYSTRRILTGEIFVSEVLSHHGVKGQKWGVRKEEPTSSKISGMGKEVAVALAPYAAVIAAYVTFHLIDSGQVHQIKSKNTPIKIDKRLSDKNLSVNQLQKIVVKPINPDFGKRGTKANCRRCTFAYELRRRGLDVTSTKSIAATGQTDKGLLKAINPKGSLISSKHELAPESAWGEKQIGDRSFYKKSSQKKSDEIFNSLNKLPNRSRGELAIGWHFGGGHSVAWEKVNGKAVIFDTQSGKKYESSSSFAREFGVAIHEAAYTRLDNVDLNMEFLGRWTQNAN